MQVWLRPQENKCLLLLYVRPNSSRDEIVGLHGDRLKIKIRALPQDGEANTSLKEFVAKLLGVSKSRVEILRGESSHQKDLLVELPVSEVINRLKHLEF